MCATRYLFLILCLPLIFLPPATAGENPAAGRFVKLDEQAKELPDDAPHWVMVKDTGNGLIWEVKTDDESVHNLNNVYSWKKSKSQFIKQLNDEKFGTFSDWRLPEEDELGSLLDKTGAPPYINDQYFPKTLPEHYQSWVLCGDGQSVNSSTIHFGDPQKDRKKPREIRVRAVRGQTAKK
ncbi:MAG: DUF1566 domain-containing protein [Proteobacteria bacterium]|nr:DUF1566 domain-containing protein [Pseudomonadota bacterium]MBU1737258.1 DUF1566 domain-containing protein [Pseudomonadota bacterium]